MSFAIKGNSVNQIPKGSIIFQENELARYVCVLVKGSILVRSEYSKMTLPAGSFFGVCDLSKMHYIADYIAEEDCVLYAFAVRDMAMLRIMLGDNNKDYRGLMINTMTRYFYEYQEPEKSEDLLKKFFELENDISSKLKDF